MTAFLIHLRELVRVTRFLFYDFSSLKQSLKEHNLIVQPKLLLSWTSKVIFLSHRKDTDHIFIKVYTSHKRREKEIGDYLHSISETPFVLPIKYIEINKYSIYAFPFQVGITLKEAIELGMQKQLNIFLENIIDLLNQLNEVAVTHGDLTPQNIIIDKYGCLKLIDFEFAIVNDHPSLGKHDESQRAFLNNLGGEYRSGNSLDNESFILSIIKRHSSLFFSTNREQCDMVVRSIQDYNE